MTHDNPAAREPSRAAFVSYPWMRVFLTIFSLALLWLAFWAVIFIAVAQLVLRLFDSDASDDLRDFAGRLGTYMGELADYVGFARDKPPFPFARFPTA